ncbi:hypothetical protein [Lacrimispora sp.]|jgi:hypothetical protein|uniref:hypothetical protein n=1 Tax=Lacrimispora sp. TaxID=2719234 RepID=UPI0028A6A30E|nr:hypothetical protein [Lacrimispora sp.]
MTIDDGITPELERIKRELATLTGMKIHIGIQGASGYGVSGEGRKGTPADIITIANVNEFGATIKAKNVKNLAIPITKKAKGKSPLDFPGLFFLRTPNGLFGCISKNRKGGPPKQKSSPSEDKPNTKKPGKKPIKKKLGDIEFLFILLESVTIPERSFIRAGYDNNRKPIEDITVQALKGIIFNSWDAEKAANHIGMGTVGIIQSYMNAPFNFKGKGRVTKSTSNWPGNPLVETGRLRNSITYRIEGGS